jgi:hypothetical protein
MSRRSKVYRAVVGVRREGGEKLVRLPCDHHHGTAAAAALCLSTRVRDLIRPQERRTPVVEVSGAVEYSHSRHDWFPIPEEKR